MGGGGGFVENVLSNTLVGILSVFSPGRRISGTKVSTHTSPGRRGGEQKDARPPLSPEETVSDATLCDGYYKIK